MHQSEWGAGHIGTAVVNLENAKWVNDRKTALIDVDQRVISWPTTRNDNIIPRNSKEWDQIFNNISRLLLRGAIWRVAVLKR